MKIFMTSSILTLSINNSSESWRLLISDKNNKFLIYGEYQKAILTKTKKQINRQNDIQILIEHQFINIAILIVSLKIFRL